MSSYTISIIGGGNVAFRLSIALHTAGHKIVSIYNRDSQKAEKIIRALKKHKSNTILANSLDDIPPSDIILICVSDGAIKEIASKLTNKKSLILHTSGATDISVLKDCNIHSYGVLYPLMTLSINKEIDIKIVPFLIEASGTKEIDILINIVNSFKAEYKICTSDERLKMHTAAVFGTNFINYILSLAYDISHPDFVFLLPSVIETVRKAFLINPKVSQTGPAVREDMETINKHIKYLASKNLLKEEEVYKFLTNNIIDKFAVKNE